MRDRADAALTHALLCLILSQVAHFWLLQWLAGLFFAVWAIIAFLWFSVRQGVARDDG